MEVIAGDRTARWLQNIQWNAGDLAQRLAGRAPVLVDLGTGDGRFVRAAALAQPQGFAIGLDACRENLRAASRRLPPNALFVIANALELPQELHGVASRLAVNFPWGSLLEGLVRGDPGLLNGLLALCREGAGLEVRLNGEALARLGLALEAGGAQIQQALAQAGFKMQPMQAIDVCALRAIPATWARRLAFGRDPRALLLRGQHRGAKTPDFAPLR